MKDLLDVHTHTIASGHAYSSLREMTAAAKEKGLALLGITEHAPQMPGSCHEIYFHNFKVIDRQAFGIPLLMGCELNIMDFTGSVDLDIPTLKKIDYAIASLHDPCIRHGSVEENTTALIGAMQNPYVQIIGHPDNGNYPVDYERLVRAAKKHHVLLEVNNNSCNPVSGRKNSWQNALTMLAYCKTEGVSVIMNSDAHIDLDVGNHRCSLQLIEEANFPEELVVNNSIEKFLSFLHT